MHVLFVTTARFDHSPYGDGSTRYRCFNLAEELQACKPISSSASNITGGVGAHTSWEFFIDLKLVEFEFEFEF